MMMMHLFRRFTQKQYDGPAANANVASESGTATNDSSGLSRPTARPPRPRPRPNGGDRRHRRSRSHDDHRANNATSCVPLASGISSRRTSERVREHLPAGVMKAHNTPSSATGTTGGGARRRASDNGGGRRRQLSKGQSWNGGRAIATADSDRGDGKDKRPSTSRTQSTVRKSKPQIPMEHDGGVLCVAAIPGEYLSNANNVSYGGVRTYRFLSGGTDGIIKLWEVNEHPSFVGIKSANGRELIPRPIRTYRGHSGYINSIAVLGTLHDPTAPGEDENGAGGSLKGTSCHSLPQSEHRLDKSHRTSCTASSGDSHGSVVAANRGHASGFRNPKDMLPASVGRRMSQLCLDSGGGERLLSAAGRLLFVSASRDNTLRVWSIDDRGQKDSDGPKDGRKDSSADPFAKGIKLRGHQFSKDSVGGVLCVCAVPSLPPSDDEDDHDDDFGTTNGATAGGEGTPAPTVSAGQFCSGGSDGLVRVWDVRSALRSFLGKVSGSGTYGTAQLQSLGQGVELKGGPPLAAITSVVCTSCGGVLKDGEEVALFAGDARGTVKRYSRKNESGSGHVNSAIWWVCTGKFTGHTHPITGMAMLSSPMLTPLLCPNVDICAEDKDILGTMLVSTCKDGSISVWDAFDARIHSQPDDSYDKQRDDYFRAKGRIPLRAPMWEIELNDDDRDSGKDNESGTRPNSSAHRMSACTAATSLTTLQAGTLMSVGTTNGLIRMWNVSSGLYEGAYNLGKHVQIWSLGILSERQTTDEHPSEEGDGDDGPGDRMVHSVGLIVSGDNRGRIRVLRKASSRVSND